MTNKTTVTRRALLGGMAGFGVVSAAPSFANAPAVLSGAGNIRRIRMYSQRTGEKLDSVYWIDGQYVPEVMDEISFLMRDWRQNMVIPMDPALIDVMAAAHSVLETDEPYQMMSGYRTPETNAMLRRSNRGVARNSYHTRGMAADLRLLERSSWDMYRAAVSLSGGGVGRYRRSGFVHYDCGPVRSWQS
ncbi:uncharacterized protein YcbK (DUF882 family) [Rubricella aquisinus]|uniref:Murein endopeptidase K n=1 Tax=Rubricella aquisinus TaxID=2028108 RepID=A0A840WQF7_9RHOB|nr:DUF882 domain-containing protein [Rubricella aquisinus]MBB5516283.1 uncharacterized protein YcbK (DUF882 family) [Rubricella aquisinus]